jgi:4-aminobutyrate aminotransferase
MAESVALDPQTLIPRVIGRYTPVFVDHARGVSVWDRDGREYLDFTSGIAVVNTGHCHPVVVEAIQRQAEKVIHAQQNILLHEPMLQAAQVLTSTLPASLDQVFWANSGAEAVEGAMKLAKVATRRPAIIAFRGAFHGRTHGTMSVTSSRAKVRGHYEPLLASVYFAPYPYYFRSPVKGTVDDADDFYLSELRSLFDTLVMPDDVAGILIETIAGEGGYLVPSQRFLREVRSICDEHGILLIMDEVQSGVGRTGKLWGFEHFDVVPDVMTVAKGIASGMPVSAVAANRSIMDHWAPGAHGGTYGANAVGTAAVAATLRVMQDEQLPERARVMGERLMAGLRELQVSHPVIGDVRGLGLMVAAEFVDDAGGPNAQAVTKVVSHCLENGILLITCGTYDQAIRIVPPLVVDEGQIDRFLEVFGGAVASL